MSFEPNERLAGERDSNVWIPAPSRATLTSAAFECTVAVPDFAPTVDGSNVIRRAHVSPACNSFPFTQSDALPVTCENDASLTSTPEPVTSSVPLLVTVEVCDAVAPSSMSFEPNDRLAGER